jgi:hypothetical protein
MKLPLLVAWALAVLLGGCWAEESPPGVTPCSCNNNGKCETSTEDCSCCQDCPCCRAVLAVGSDVKDADNATGNDDGTFATLGATSTLTLMVGSQIALPFGGGLTPGGDFVLVGQVTSDSTLTVSGNCAAGTPSGDGYQVEVSTDGNIWELVGFWTKTRSPDSTGTGQAFNLGCATAKPNQVRHIRLAPLGNNPAAQLDAVVVLPDSCGSP